MNLKKSLAFGLVFALSAMGSAQAQQPTNLAPLVGTWVNVNPATRGIVKVVITNGVGGLKVHTYGACSPTPCDHGEVSADAFSTGVGDSKAKGFSASYDHVFKTALVTGQRKGALLAVESRSKFAGGDNRFDYLSSELFRRKLVILKPPVLR